MNIIDNNLFCCFLKFCANEVLLLTLLHTLSFTEGMHLILFTMPMIKSIAAASGTQRSTISLIWNSIHLCYQTVKHQLPNLLQFNFRSVSGLVLVGTGTGAQIRKQKLPMSRHAEDQYLRIVLSCFGSVAFPFFLNICCCLWNLILCRYFHLNSTSRKLFGNMCQISNKIQTLLKKLWKSKKSKF